jgi:hypothetical protein
MAVSDWQVGELAVCVDVDWYDCNGRVHVPRTIQLGEVRRVEAVVPADCGQCVGLIFADTRAVAQRFRKIRPDAHEACESEFMTLLKKSRQTVKA